MSNQKAGNAAGATLRSDVCRLQPRLGKGRAAGELGKGRAARERGLAGTAGTDGVRAAA